MLICKTSMEEHEEGMLYECSYLNGHVASLFFKQKMGIEIPSKGCDMARKKDEGIDRPAKVEQVTHDVH